MSISFVLHGTDKAYRKSEFYERERMLIFEPRSMWDSKRAVESEKCEQKFKWKQTIKHK